MCAVRLSTKGDLLNRRHPRRHTCIALGRDLFGFLVGLTCPGLVRIRTDFAQITAQRRGNRNAESSALSGAVYSPIFLASLATWR
jgi:hypothetical protein